MSLLTRVAFTSEKQLKNSSHASCFDFRNATLMTIYFWCYLGVRWNSFIASSGKKEKTHAEWIFRQTIWIWFSHILWKQNWMFPQNVLPFQASFILPYSDRRVQHQLVPIKPFSFTVSDTAHCRKKNFKMNRKLEDVELRQKKKTGTKNSGILPKHSSKRSNWNCEYSISSPSNPFFFLGFWHTTNFFFNFSINRCTAHWRKKIYKMKRKLKVVELPPKKKRGTKSYAILPKHSWKPSKWRKQSSVRQQTAGRKIWNEEEVQLISHLHMFDTG